MQAEAADLASATGLTSAHTSIVGNGLDGVLLAFVLVEITALALPRWRPLRHGRGRVQLMRATFIVAAALVVAQAMLSAWALRTFGWELIEPGLGPLLIDALALTLGTLALLVGARIVSRWGTGHGLSVVAVLGALPAWLARAEMTTATGDDPEALVRTLVFATMATVAILGREVRGERLPVAGLVPLLAPGWVMQLVSFASIFVVLDLSWLFAPSLWTVVTVAMTLTIGLAWLQQPGFASLRARGAAIALSAALPGLIVAGDRALGFDVSFFGAGAGLAFFVIAVACTMDVLREAGLRTRTRLVPILVFSDLAVADRVGRRLAEADIAHVMRAVGHRTLLRFFGPWVPVKLLVDRDRADEASRLAYAEANREAHEEITRFF